MPKIVAQTLVYEEFECVSRAIKPWVSVCERIDVFEGAFQTLTGLGFPLRSQDGTVELLQDLASQHKNIKVNHHWDINEPVLRNHHLWSTIKDFGRDTILFILDADEIYSEEEVKKCVESIQNKEYNTFWCNFKNYVGDEHTFYRGFRVPRFFPLGKACGFSGYNDVCFTDGIRSIDIENVLPKHLSWCPVSKAIRKIKWQNSLGWQCSFAVDGNKVSCNDNYYMQTGKTKPIFEHE